MSDLFSTKHDDGNTTDQTEGRNESNNAFNMQDYTNIDATVIIICVLNVPLMVMSIMGNALVLAAIIRTPSIRSPSMIMLSNLAISDLLVGFLAQPLFIANELTKMSNVFVSNLAQMAVLSFCGVSLSTITAITLDRFMAVHYHMRYATLVTKFRASCTVAMIWLTNFALPGFYLANKRLLNQLIAVFIVICFIISTFSYIRIYLIVRQHQSQILAQQQAVQSFNAGSNLDIAPLRKSAINTFMFYIVLISCYFPTFVLLTLYGASYRHWKIEWKFATTVVFMNSSINPILYCWRLGELRTAVLKTARQMLLCKQTGQA